ncbi:hypothetical protein PoB_000974900 [Plakobranchus ocellatus]|uniref:Arrestin-like N-terminal domain-containing protein n=1 Tax=Plakobranchus ocellatus TaxID=259542 RepID=A0AAV3YMF3_9GAST|nr:hypothetical protein PoB_000974900 [Plakobranchus ocellatus]
MSEKKQEKRHNSKSFDQINLKLTQIEVHSSTTSQRNPRGDRYIFASATVSQTPEIKGDFRLLGSSSGQDAGDEARTHARRIAVDLRADSPATVLPTPQHKQMTDCPVSEQPVKRFDLLLPIGYSQGVGKNFTPYFVSVSFTKLACGKAYSSPQQGDFRLLGSSSGQGVGDEARTHARRIAVDLRADSPATVLPTPPHKQMTDCPVSEQPVKRFDLLLPIGYSQGVGKNFTPYFVSVSFTS